VWWQTAMFNVQFSTLNTQGRHSAIDIKHWSVATPH
jgi:hypothetical protein